MSARKIIDTVTTNAPAMKGPGYFFNGEARYVSTAQPTAVASAALRAKSTSPMSCHFSLMHAISFGQSSHVRRKKKKKKGVRRIRNASSFVGWELVLQQSCLTVAYQARGLEAAVRRWIFLALRCWFLFLFVCARFWIPVVTELCNVSSHLHGQDPVVVGVYMANVHHAEVLTTPQINISAFDVIASSVGGSSFIAISLL